MPKGQDTRHHPSRRVDRPAFSPVVTIQEAREMTDDEREQEQRWYEGSKLADRYENIDRSINFPPRSQ